ncbi:MAG: H4MPT-linked C1 transfer pathway protein [Planctomycetes bacterium]|nr:H4MPT-linked C1 transfer pathway protein [Planctomycetota bacterium]
MSPLGLDIGGAYLKASDGVRTSVTRPFAVWKQPDGLGAAVVELLGGFGACDLLAVTMTAELADCFSTKAEGVKRVLSAVEAAAGGRPVFVWQTGAEFVSPHVAREIPLLVAAANWHALATWAGRIVPRGAALLVDIGSTTTDIVPLLDGVPCSIGFTDRERLEAGELVYSGSRRTPVCAIAHSVPTTSGYCPLAAELFATTLDIYLLLGRIPEDAADCETANGRPVTVEHAHDRLARALCCDRTELPLDEAREIARFLADVQRQRISGAVDRVLSRVDGEPCGVILSGSGAFIGRDVVESHRRLKGVPVHALRDLCDPAAAEAACAFAVARLAAERLAEETG